MGLLRLISWIRNCWRYRKVINQLPQASEPEELSRKFYALQSFLPYCDIASYDTRDLLEPILKNYPYKDWAEVNLAESYGEELESILNWLKSNTVEPYMIFLAKQLRPYAIDRLLQFHGIDPYRSSFAKRISFRFKDGKDAALFKLRFN